MGSREAGGVVLALLGIAALLMAVNGTMGKVWADIAGKNGPDTANPFTPWSGGNGGNPSGPTVPPAGGSTFDNVPGPSPAQPPPNPFRMLAGFPGSGVRTNA